jgi:AraC-like DNA-binding protein
MDKKPAKMGAPKKELDWDQLDKYLGFDHTLKACAFFLGISESTIERRIKEKTGLTFDVYREPFLEKLKSQISQAGLDEAVNKRNTVILKMYLQKYCNFQDAVKQTNVTELSDDSNALVEELKRLVKK